MNQRDFWNHKKVVVTGGAGFLGSFIVEKLLVAGANVTVPVMNFEKRFRFLGDRCRSYSTDRLRFTHTDLKNLEQSVESFSGSQVIIAAAATVGGIKFNKENPGKIFRENMLLELNSIEAARLVNCERYCFISSACVYPSNCTIPTPEIEGFLDRPEETNEGYGFSKRMGEFACNTYQSQYGLNTLIVRPYNLFGPRDNFDPKSSHVIPSLIYRLFHEKENPLTVWGSGDQTRSFMFVEDAAEGIVELTAKFSRLEPVNLGSDHELTIRQLVGELVEIFHHKTGKKVNMMFDRSMPEGQLRRNCDSRLFNRLLPGFERTKLKTGLEQTINWYLKNCDLEGIL